MNASARCVIGNARIDHLAGLLAMTGSDAAMIIIIIIAVVVVKKSALGATTDLHPC